jgi:hypothetical protein
MQSLVHAIISISGNPLPRQCRVLATPSCSVTSSPCKGGCKPAAGQPLLSAPCRHHARIVLEPTSRRSSSSCSSGEPPAACPAQPQGCTQ